MIVGSRLVSETIHKKKSPTKLHQSLASAITEASRLAGLCKRCGRASLRYSAFWGTPKQSAPMAGASEKGQTSGLPLYWRFRPCATRLPLYVPQSRLKRKNNTKSTCFYANTNSAQPDNSFSPAKIASWYSFGRLSNFPPLNFCQEHWKSIRSIELCSSTVSKDRVLITRLILSCSVFMVVCVRTINSVYKRFAMQLFEKLGRLGLRRPKRARLCHCKRHRRNMHRS